MKILNLASLLLVGAVSMACTKGIPKNVAQAPGVSLPLEQTYENEYFSIKYPVG